MGWGSFSMLEQLPRPDVWNLHWVSNFLDWEEMLPRMADVAPIVWTLHDLNPLMGIWHFEPSLEEQTDARRRLEEKAVVLKQKALRRIPKERLTFVGPSRWMVEKCRKSPVTEGFSVEHIPYSLDTDVFCPRDRSLFRRMYEIPESSIVIGFVADVLSDPRKGMKELVEAVQLLETHGQQVHLMTVGNGELPPISCPHSHLGPIHNDYLLSFFYSTCDLFVCPSLQDNLPNTVLESLACGTPVLGFDTGGLPDMVREDYSGKLVSPVGDGNALGATMRSLLSVPDELQRLARRLAALQLSTMVFPFRRAATRVFIGLFQYRLYRSAREYCRI